MAGRPRIKIDKNVLDVMLQYGATCLDCADKFNCSEDTIANYIKRKYKMNFSEYSHKRQATVRMKLREKQIQMALNGNVTLLIWLGKQKLGQVEETTLNQTSNIVQLKYSIQGTPDELRKQIKLENETQSSDGASEDKGHSES